VPLTDEQRSAAVDIVGTGGDHSHSINVSTMAAIVTAAAGVPVCKHGARGASSKCGTADVLEALGVAIELPPDAVARCVADAGIGFCFAPAFHPAFRFAAPSRREIGIPTVFNLLGPMANPGRVRRQVIGVANAAFAERMIETLRTHGSVHAWVVHGGGLDELTTTGPSQVIELRDGAIRHFTVDAAELGLARAHDEDLAGGEPPHNAAVVRRVLAGEPGPHRDIVVLNAAAGLVVGGKVDSLADGAELAAATIDSGDATETLERFVTISQEAAG
jgi:anthranilate phosphoribosyltransferase